MKRVSDFIRINTTPNPDYPSGQIKDATDKYTEDGTVINQNFIQDWYNFFQKCVRDSGIVPNGDFDTATNAQLFDAVKKATTGITDWELITSFDGNSRQNSEPSDDDLMIRFNAGYVEIFGTYFQGTSGNGFYVPAKYVPEKNKMRMITASDFTSVIAMSINAGENKIFFYGEIESRSIYVNGRYKFD